jgi:hypothetical protein
VHMPATHLASLSLWILLAMTNVSEDDQMDMYLGHQEVIIDCPFRGQWTFSTTCICCLLVPVLGIDQLARNPRTFSVLKCLHIMTRLLALLFTVEHCTLIFQQPQSYDTVTILIWGFV